MRFEIEFSQLPTCECGTWKAVEKTRNISALGVSKRRAWKALAERLVFEIEPSLIELLANEDLTEDQKSYRAELVKSSKQK